MDFLIERAKMLEPEIIKQFAAHKIEVEIIGGQINPGLRRYIFNIQPMPGAKVQKIYDCAEDIQISMKLHLFRPFKDRGTLRLAVSEHDIKENKLLKILGSDAFRNSSDTIPLAIGFDFMGNKHIADLKKLVHLLIIGPSGTGKSVAIWCIILSIITKCSVSSVRLLLFDIMSNSLALFSDVKHLYHPIVKDAEKGMQVLESLVALMRERLELGEEACESLEFVVCVIDELDETIAGIVGNKELFTRFTVAINSLIHGGRKAKIILILGSHHPTIKNTKININGIVPRIVFQTAKNNSSSTVGVAGANKLAGEGEMIFRTRKDAFQLQGSFVTKDEIRDILSNEPLGCNDLDMLEIVTPPLLPPQLLLANNADTQDDDISMTQVSEEFANITMWALQQNEISSLQIQNEFRMGKRANRIVDELCRMGIVEALFANQKRKVLPQRIQDLSREIIDFLAYFGHTEEDLQKVFDDKLASNNEEINSNRPKREIPQRVPKISAMCELENLIGLDVVKARVKEVTTFIERRRKKNAKITLHMCFRGNPGVGKTTVARIIARILYEAGVIKKNLLVETDRGGLIGLYVGHTADKTQRIIDSAMGGVLFIDEAYSLFSGSEKDFGDEAVATLVKQMEDNRDKFVCILAGYTNEMDSMLDMNPGLRDRIQFYIDFPDYDEHELLQIFERLCTDNKYELSKAARDTLVGEFSRVITAKSQNFSNGRFARKVFERVQMKQANRTCDDTITDEDIKAVFAEPDILTSFPR